MKIITDLEGLADPWVRLEINVGPLSDCNERGSPNRGMICSTRVVVTSDALSILVGKAFIHPVKVSVITRRYLKPLQGGKWVKSICQSSPGWFPHHWTE